MTTPNISPLIPNAVRAQLLHELDTLFGHCARTICRLDTDSGAIDECTPAAELVRRIAVVVAAGKIVQLMETSLLMDAAAHPGVTQAALVPALGLTQQGVSHRLSKLVQSRPAVQPQAQEDAGERIKMKCPTCWGETYRKSTDDEDGFWEAHYQASPSCRP